MTAPKEVIKLKNKKDITKELVLSLFSYDAINGAFYWKYDKRFINDKAGSIKPDGYRRIIIQGHNYAAHHLVWLVETGKLPKIIDHINGKRDDNRFINLRESSPRSNQLNRIEHRSGRLVGAYKVKDKDKWLSYIVVNKRKTFLGTFDSEKAANKAYMKKLKEIQKGG